MLQISLPIFGDHLDILIKDRQDPKLVSAVSESFDGLIVAARENLDIFEAHSGIRKLTDSDSLRTIDLPQIVTLYVQFWLAIVDGYTPNQLLTEASTDFLTEMTLEKSLSITSINSSLVIPFLIHASIELAKLHKVQIESIATQHWGYAQSAGYISFLNPLTDSEIEFHTTKSGYMLDYYDQRSKAAYVLFSPNLGDLGQFQLQVRHSTNHLVSLQNFSALHPINRIWQLDSDNLAHLIDE